MDVRTTKPISTISYNSPDYLVLKLEELRKAKIVAFWAFVHHLPEDDEAGNKQHSHVYIELAKIVQTEDLREEFKQYDPNKPDKPLGCITFRSSKNFGDWYLYGIHDKAYLASKGQSRKYHYKFADVITSDPDDLLFKVRSIDLLAISPYTAMLDAQAQGITWTEYFRRGTVPLQQITLCEKAWFLLLGDKIERSGRSTHSPKTAPEPSEEPSELDCEVDQALAHLDEIADKRDLSFYEIHPDAPYTPLDPEEELPW